MKALVVEITVKMIEESRLVDAPVSSERHHVWQRLLRVGRCLHEMRIIWLEALRGYLLDFA